MTYPRPFRPKYSMPDPTRNLPPGHDEADAVATDDLAKLELRIARHADSLSPFYGAGREKDAERWERAAREVLGLPVAGT
jgi:hypothetical protein